MSTEIPPRAWVEVRGSALLRNLEAVRAAAGPSIRLIAMVKANGYGLGVEPLIRILETEPLWGYGVASVEEGRELRELGVRRPVLVFSPVPPGAEAAAVAAGLTLCVSDAEALERLAAAARSAGTVVTAHLEIDTGMGRAGFPDGTIDRWRPRVAELTVGSGEASQGSEEGAGGVRLGGLFTHYHSADAVAGAARASIEAQQRRLAPVLASLEGLLSADAFVHLSNSAGILRGPRSGSSVAEAGVRPGIFLYGGRAGETLPDPEPVVTIRARVIRVARVPAGATQGYGSTYRADGEERWATLAIGYGDGLPRALSNRGSVLLHGHEAPIVGRISMDVTVVDITGLPSTRPGDLATIVGRDGDRERTLDAVAREAGTISYEILTGLSRRLPRVWLPD
ncbi:MAG: alanine racemase [Gemmatimonadales bacterium]|nr:MAG: alanine racemase [Gemmatimonadales bacterium]